MAARVCPLCEGRGEIPGPVPPEVVSGWDHRWNAPYEGDMHTCHRCEGTGNLS